MTNTTPWKHFPVAAKDGGQSAEKSGSRRKQAVVREIAGAEHFRREEEAVVKLGRKRRNPAAGRASEHRVENRDRIRGGNSFAKLSIRIDLHGAKANFKGNYSLLEHVKLSFFLHGKPSPASLRIREKLGMRIRLKVIMRSEQRASGSGPGLCGSDQDMYCTEVDQPARARTSNLNEELGQVNTILSDKTGTLTCNSMEFLRCSIAGVDYGWGNTVVDKVLCTGTQDGEIGFQPEASSVNTHANGGVLRRNVKGFSFIDDRLMSGSWVNEGHHDLIQMFFRVLAVCHTAIPVVDSKYDDISYEAESPDEATFVVAARELGFKFYEKTQESISLHEFETSLGRMMDSSRKRMSVIIMTEEGQILIFCKGADRLAKDEQIYVPATRDHINEYSESGLRTMVIAYCMVIEEEFNIWYEEFSKASNSVSCNRDEMVDAAAEKIERDLILLGATAFEDRLQKGINNMFVHLPYQRRTHWLGNSSFRQQFSNVAKGRKWCSGNIPLFGFYKSGTSLGAKCSPSVLASVPDLKCIADASP
ncbi:putative phospholipid-transporting ATPase 9 [Platanthera zijinensis]|uniref:Phospholipid-transporting ATPase 9 n=1 Tax=Platanthera zijinensis TaxID=2320716 RepID=A0AAP0GFR4_9ASPA